MAKKNDIDKMLESMLEQLSEKDPELLETLSKAMEMRANGEGYKVLDELRDFKSNKHMVTDLTFEHFDDLPKYLDFWNEYDGENVEAEYRYFMGECKKRSKKQLTADINHYLESIPAGYNSDLAYVNSHQMLMLAAAIAKFKLDGCKLPLLNVLRCEDWVIKDGFMDDESSSINIFAELCHDHLQNLFDIAVDDRVMPYARGIAIGALAKSAKFAPKDSLLIQGLLRKVIETYQSRAKADRKVSVALIRATALCAARMHFASMLDFIQETYRKMRISGKGAGAISRVEALMNDADEKLGTNESIVENMEAYLAFQSQFTMPDFSDEDNDDLENFDDEEDYFGFNDDLDKEYDYDDDSPKIELSDLQKASLTNGKLQILGKDLVMAHPKNLRPLPTGRTWTLPMAS